MSWFSRRRRDEDLDPDQGTEGGVDDGDLDEEALDDEGAADAAGEARPVRHAAPEGSGPWDLGDVEDPAEGGRINLGGLWIPAREGLEVRVEADQETGEVVAVTLVHEDGALQLQPFAAPRTEGIWDEVRAEIRAGVTQQGGTADEVDGPLGPELRTRVPVRAQDGSSSVQPARFLGIDGPRWFLRAVVTGRPALEPGTDAVLLELFRDVVVVRGAAPMAPRDPIPLTLPNEVDPDAPGGGSGGDGDDDPLNPFTRGPEITELH